MLISIPDAIAPDRPAPQVSTTRERLVVRGGAPLRGEVRISGAKNAALPLLAASLLTDEPLLLDNLPHLRDVSCMLQLLGSLGVDIHLRADQGLELSARSSAYRQLLPTSLMKAMRASFLLLGPLLSRFGHAELSFPGGDGIGARPIDEHLRAFSLMGASFEIDRNRILAKAEKGLKGAEIDLAFPTVTGSENIMMAATLARGVTIIRNAAREPEVRDLGDCLNAMGARISGHGASEIRIEGTDALGAARHQVLPDRIETGTYLAAAAISGGKVKTLATDPSLLTAVLDKFREAGCDLTLGADFVELDMTGRRLCAVDIETAPYPGFPTDMQAQFMALNCVAHGSSRIIENIFENRFHHARELARLGASIDIRGSHEARLEGGKKLHGGVVVAADLRASFSLLMAALTIPEETQVEECWHIDRGYEFVDEKLRKLGADLARQTY